MIVGDRPTHGVRLRLLLDRSGRRYEGTATTRDAQWKVVAAIAEDGTVTVDTAAPAEFAEYARRVVRVAARSAEGARPPRLIQRWRAAKE
jgi:hypothetical protein